MQQYLDSIRALGRTIKLKLKRDFNFTDLYSIQYIIFFSKPLTIYFSSLYLSLLSLSQQYVPQTIRLLLLSFSIQVFQQAWNSYIVCLPQQEKQQQQEKKTTWSMRSSSNGLGTYRSSSPQQSSKRSRYYYVNTSTSLNVWWTLLSTTTTTTTTQ